MVGWWLMVGGATAAQTPSPTAQEPLVIELFSRAGCTHCQTASVFVHELARTHGAELRHHRIDEDPAALERLNDLTTQSGHALVAVPAVYVRGQLFIGFESVETTGRAIGEWIAHGSNTSDGDGAICSVDANEPCEPQPGSPPSTVRIPWLGTLDVRDLGLPTFTIALGLVDGFNPCAMWVLLFVLSMLIHLKSRARMALIGGTFVLVSGLVYFVFMAAWLNFFLIVGFSRWLQPVLGGIALVIGGIHVKDFFALKQGISLSIPEASKPGIYRRARDVLKAESLPSSLVTVVVLAVMVNMVELLCTAGLPAVYTQILTSRELDQLSYYAYLGLYNLAYMLDDAAMLTVAVVTLSQRKLQERGGRVLKLVSGLVMASLGLLLLFKPEWLAFS